MRPLIGICCCVKGFGLFNMPNHAVSDHYVRVVMGPVAGMPVLLPAAGDAVAAEMLPRLDGLLLTGSRSNVHPDNYQGPAHAEGTPEDPQRDSTTLPMIRAAIAAGLPLLAICRGFQELNVALGGSLDQRIQDLPGRFDHSTPSDQRYAKLRTAKAHGLRLAPGSFTQQLAEGAETVPVNSLHNQGIARLAPGLVAEGWAPDGTVEAVRVADAPGYAYGVQWHPEYDWQHDALSRRIFESFGEACAARATARAAGAVAPLAQAAE